MKNEFQYRLVKAIERADITAAELADRTGISEASISNYINGKYVAKQDRCYAIAKALGVDPGWLMTGDEPTIHDLVNNAVHAGMIMGQNISGPKTEEAKIISGGIDKMPPEQREQALKVLQTIFSDYFSGGKKDET